MCMFVRQTKRKKKKQRVAPQKLLNDRFRANIVANCCK